MAPAAGVTVKMSGAVKPASAKALTTASRTCCSAASARVDVASSRAFSGQRGQRDGRTAEPAACHPGADGAPGAGGVHCKIQFRAGDFEIVAHGYVACVEQGTDGRGAVRRQAFHRLEYAVVLSDDVTDPAEGHLVQEPACFVEVTQLDIAQCFDAEDLGTQLARCAA